MARLKNVFHQRAAQKLMRAVLGQAILDALDPAADAEDKADAVDFLFTERSDLFIMSQGISNLDRFRDKLRERFSQREIEVWIEDRKPVTFARLVEVPRTVFEEVGK
jgi:hypothetical protein